MNYQLVSVVVVRNLIAETVVETVAEAGSGFSSYYACAATITTTVADAATVYSAAITADAVNGLSFFLSSAAAVVTVPGSNVILQDKGGLRASFTHIIKKQA